MMHCPRHNCFFQGARCEKCLDGEKPYKYVREEVADPIDWAAYQKRGWTKNG